MEVHDAHPVEGYEQARGTPIHQRLADKDRQIQELQALLEKEQLWRGRVENVLHEQGLSDVCSDGSTSQTSRCTPSWHLLSEMSEERAAASSVSSSKTNKSAKSMDTTRSFAKSSVGSSSHEPFDEPSCQDANKEENTAHLDMSSAAKEGSSHQKAHLQLPSPRAETSCIGDNEGMSTLDGVWLSADGEPIACVRNLRVQWLGETAGEVSEMRPCGLGVWSMAVDGDMFWAESQERDDDTLMLCWSDGETWERQQEVIGDHIVRTCKKSKQVKPIFERPHDGEVDEYGAFLDQCSQRYAFRSGCSSTVTTFENGVAMCFGASAYVVR